MKGLAAAMVEVFSDLRSMRAHCPPCRRTELSGSEGLSVRFNSVSRIVEPPWRISKALVRAWNGGPYRRRGAEQAPTFAADHDRWTVMNLI